MNTMSTFFRDLEPPEGSSAEYCTLFKVWTEYHALKARSLTYSAERIAAFINGLTFTDPAAVAFLDNVRTNLERNQ